MKLLAVIFCLVISVSGLAQEKVDSSKYVNNNILYVVDGVPVSKEKVDKNEILIRQSISGKKLEESGFYPEKMIDSIVVMVSKNGAIKSYQKKFSAFSKRYKAYLEDKKANKNVLYVLNGVTVSESSIDGIKTLYDMPSKKIKKVFLLKETNPNFSNAAAIVVITTKK
ncbi:MAG: hypothetical protein ACHQHN_15765 [Sphingobacteriales bacterium]